MMSLWIGLECERNEGVTDKKKKKKQIFHFEYDLECK